MADIPLASQTPPARLYHGTADRFLTSIRHQGLRKKRRDYVQLAASEALATRSGPGSEDAVVLRIDAERMEAAGFLFFQTENGVWLTEHVPRAFILFPRRPIPRPNEEASS